MAALGRRILQRCVVNDLKGEPAVVSTVSWLVVSADQDRKDGRGRPSWEVVKVVEGIKESDFFESVRRNGSRCSLRALNGWRAIR